MKRKAEKKQKWVQYYFMSGYVTFQNLHFSIVREAILFYAMFIMKMKKKNQISYK